MKFLAAGNCILILPLLPHLKICSYPIVHILSRTVECINAFNYILSPLILEVWGMQLRKLVKTLSHMKIIDRMMEDPKNLTHLMLNVCYVLV